MAVWVKPPVSSHFSTICQSTLGLADVAGNGASPPSILDHRNCACQRNAEEMRGFKVCLVINQVLMLVLMFASVLVTYLMDSQSYIMLSIYSYVEVFILIFALIHACRPSIHMMLVFLALGVANAVSMVIVALVVAVRNSDKDCSRVDCGWLSLEVEERFYLFWFLICKATFALFLGLVSLAISPQMHNYMAEDECERAIFMT